MRKLPPGLLPLAIVAVLTLSPLMALVYGAVEPGFFEGKAHFSLQPLVSTYTSVELWESLWGTAGLAAAVGLVSTGVGVLFSWLVARTNIPFPRLLEIVIILPLFTSPFIASIAWFAVAAPQSGIANVMLSALLGRHISFLNMTSLGGVAWVLIVHYIPYAYLFGIGALQNLDASLEEASYLNGSGAFLTFWRVTLPLIVPALASSFVFIMILSAGVFSVPAVLGRNLPFVPLSVLIYTAASGFSPDYSRAASIATALFLLSLTLYFTYRRLTRRERRYVTVSGRGFAVRRVNLGRARGAVTGAVLLYGLVGAVVPTLALIFTAITPYAQRDLSDVRFTLKNVTDVLSSPDVHDALLNTLVVVLATTLICSLLGLVSVFASRRAPKETCII